MKMQLVRQTNVHAKVSHVGGAHGYRVAHNGAGYEQSKKKNNN